MLTDTHAHLDYPDFAEDFDAVLKRAEDAGVHRIVTIATGIESSKRAVALAEKYPMVYAVVGVHPSNVGDESADFLPVLRDLALHPKAVAIGETGLDFHRLPEDPAEAAPGMAALGAGTAGNMHADVVNGAYKAAQEEAFRAHLELAAELGLNVVIHQRDAWIETLEVMKPFAGRLRGVFHCFGGSADQAAEIIVDGHLVSFTGIVTFKNAGLVRETAAGVPEGSFMVETDCPYLAPAPHRGSRCEPWHTSLVAAAVANARGVEPSVLAAQTEATADRFFAFRKA